MIEDIIIQNNQYVNEEGKFTSITLEGEIPGYGGKATIIDIESEEITIQTSLDEINNAASIQLNPESGENTQENIEIAAAIYKELERKIRSEKSYTITETKKDNKIYQVTIKENEEKNQTTSTTTK